MVKGNKIFFSLKYSILLIMVLFWPCYTLAKDRVSNNVSNSSQNNDYKVVQQKISLLPLTPLAVLGLNTYLIKKNNASYLVIISPVLKKYSWLIDTIKVRKELVVNQDDDDFIQNIPVNLYLSESIELLISVKKINSPINNNQDLFNNSELKFTLPYFIVINNKFNGKVYLLQEGNVDVNLNNNGIIKIKENIKVKFNQKHIDNLEILVGFKQNPKDFTNLQNYITTSAASKYQSSY